MTRPFTLIAASLFFLVMINNSTYGQKEPKWDLLWVPGTWEDRAAEKYHDLDGFAWYRCYVEIPARWKATEITLAVESIDNANEVYFNGKKIGAAGSMPPSYSSGLSQSQRIKIPPELIESGKYHLLAIRVYDKEGRGGFKGRAPAVLSNNQAVNTEGKWQFTPGDNIAWSKLPTVVTPPLASYSKITSEKQWADPATNKALSITESLEKFESPEDLTIEPVLSEPAVRQPLSMSFDERGRMWVIQYLQYPYPAGLQMVSRDKFWRAVYDKIPPPPPNHFKGADKITIHEDSDGDGVFDTHKTFLDGLNIATSCAPGRGGVWVLNPPYLLFYPDKNNDDRPDGPPEVHLQGFGMEDTHSVANSLRWGPDGWLYGAQGSTVSGNVSQPGSDQPPINSLGQNIWRYHPERRQYEIFAEGGGNAFGVEIDSQGRVYSGHNGGNTRGFHYVQGGYYRKGFSKHGPLSNPYAFGFFEAMKHVAVPRFTHTYVIYEAGVLPPHYHGKLFGVHPLMSHVVYSKLERNGSTFQTTDLGKPMQSKDIRFRPVDIKVGPDGAIYVLDMYEPQISHRQHFEGQIDKATGRIYRLTSKHVKANLIGDLSKQSSDQLVDLLSHGNKWFRFTALRLLGDRKDQSVTPRLMKQLKSERGQLALESLWAINLVGSLDKDALGTALRHENPYVRAWAARLIGDGGVAPAQYADSLLELAASESNIEVRSQLACTARRLAAQHGLPITRELLSRDDDDSDPHIPLLHWWAIESKMTNHGEAVLKLLESTPFWNHAMVQSTILERLMRRFALSGTRKNLLACARLLDMAPDDESRKKLMAGFELAFKGRSLTGLPEELTLSLAAAGGGSPALALRQKNPDAIKHALAFVADEQSEQSERLQLIQILGEINAAECIPVLLSIVKNSANQQVIEESLASLQPYAANHIGDEVLSSYGKLQDSALEVAQSLLASRKPWTLRFLNAIDKELIDKDNIPMPVVRRMTFHQGDDVNGLIKKIWGEISGASNEQMRTLLARFSEVIKDGNGDPYNGKKLFTKTCSKCHRLFDAGGQIGPDLTSFQRKDTQNLLVNVVNPSAEVREGFETYLLYTEDGRTATGFLVDRDNKILVLRGADGKNMSFENTDVEEFIPQKQSIMPEGLLKDLSDNEVRDLFAYLRSSQPLNN